jgi:hypothetical protein
MVSKYHFRKSKLSFLDFVKAHNCNNLNIHSIKKESVCDYFIRYENLIEDITKLCKILNIKDYNINDLPHHKNSYRTKHYSEYYNEEAKRIVYKKHQKEFELFNYTFENIK